MKWLQWLLDNAWTVVIIGGVLAQMLQAMMRKKGEEDIAKGDQPAPEYEFEDPELAERTRKIREDIQRRIAQRQRGGEAEPETPPVYAEEPPPLVRDVVPRSEPEPARSSARWDNQRQAEILEQQAALAEKLQEATRMKEAAFKRTEFEQATADHSTAKRAAVRSDVVGDLRSPEALRRAFILREVLGPPVALRK